MISDCNTLFTLPIDAYDSRLFAETIVSEQKFLICHRAIVWPGEKIEKCSICSSPVGVDVLAWRRSGAVLVCQECHSQGMEKKVVFEAEQKLAAKNVILHCLANVTNESLMSLSGQLCASPWPLIYLSIKTYIESNRKLTAELTCLLDDASRIGRGDALARLWRPYILSFHAESKEAAIQELREMLCDFPSYANAYRVLALLLAGVGEIAEAVSVLEQGAKIADDSLLALAVAWRQSSA